VDAKKKQCHVRRGRLTRTKTEGADSAPMAKSGGDLMRDQHILFVEEPEAVTKTHIVLAPPTAEPVENAFSDALLEHSSAHHRRGTRQSAARSNVHIILPPPRVQPLHEMFAETMLEDACARHRCASRGSAEKPFAHIILPPPKIDPQHEVFAEAMLEDTSTHQRRSPLDWVLSIGVHFAILVTLLMIPLYFTAGLNFQNLNLTFLAPPMMPAGPPPPPMTSAAARPARVLPVRVFNAGKLTAPTFIPKAVLSAPSDAAPPDEALMVVGGVPGGIPGGQVGGVLGGVFAGIVKGVPPPAPAVAQGPKAPVRVGGEVKPPRLIFAPDPEYPVLARQARLSGVVVIEAIIDEHGKVTGMRAISGHPLLIPAALSAVARRQYEPTVLDGEPTPIDLRVEIKFSFS
jgi:protein TonB